MPCRDPMLVMLRIGFDRARRADEGAARSRGPDRSRWNPPQTTRDRRPPVRCKTVQIAYLPPRCQSCTTPRSTPARRQPRMGSTRTRSSSRASTRTRPRELCIGAHLPPRLRYRRPPSTAYPRFSNLKARHLQMVRPAPPLRSRPLTPLLDCARWQYVTVVETTRRASADLFQLSAPVSSSARAQRTLLVAPSVSFSVTPSWSVHFPPRSDFQSGAKNRTAIGTLGFFGSGATQRGDSADCFGRARSCTR